MIMDLFPFAGLESFIVNVSGIKMSVFLEEKDSFLKPALSEHVMYIS